ncbi:MAG: TlpA disulfide reductase family protein [Fibrobacteria bacterium]
MRPNLSMLLASAWIAAPLSAAVTTAPSASSAASATPPSSASSAASVPSLKSLPAFVLPDLEGKSHDSKEWKGKVVVIDFWATWCTGCRETIPVLQRLRAKFGAKGLMVAGITVDKGPKEKIARFTRKVKMDYQVLWDAEESLSPVFGYEGLPSVYVFGRDGALLKAMPQYTAALEKEMEALVEGQFQGR